MPITAYSCRWSAGPGGGNNISSYCYRSISSYMEYTIRVTSNFIWDRMSRLYHIFMGYRVRAVSNDI